MIETLILLFFNLKKCKGLGTEIWPNGSKYVGSYFMGNKQGYGKFTRKNEGSYEGEFFENDVKHKIEISTFVDIVEQR